MKKIFFLISIFLPLIAQAAAPNWTIDAAHSSVTFDNTQSGQKFSGGFKKFTGAIAFDPNRLNQSRADITLDIDSMTVGGQGDDYIPTPQWFDSVKFPAAKFTATNFERMGTDQFIAHGQLTIRDVTLPIDLPFTLVISPDGKTATMDGQAIVNRLDYHLGTGEWADPKTVGIDIPVHVHVVANRAS